MDRRSTQWTNITPEIAKKWLEANTNNFREPNSMIVNRYARDMTNGKWSANGETIKFKDGKLTDGQKRLMAVIVSGCTITSLVVHGAEPDNVDGGKPRQASAWLKFLGFKNSNALSSISRLCLAHEKGRWHSPDQQSFSVNEVLDYAKENNDRLQDALLLGGKVKARPLKLTQTILGSVVFLGSFDNEPKASDYCTWFVDKLTKGNDLADDEPVGCLRKMAMNNYLVRNRTPWSLDIQRAITTIAWNKTLQDEKAKVIQFRIAGPKKMDFPNVLNEVDV